MKPNEFKELEELYKSSIIDVPSGSKESLFSILNKSENLKSNKIRRVFYASDATRCERNLAWAITGVPKSNATISARSKNIFALGDAIHEVLETRYKNIPEWEFYPEHPGEINKKEEGRPEFLLSYRVDGVLITEGEKELMGVVTDKIICEFKTIADFPYSTGRNRQKQIYWHGAQDTPKFDHFAQLQIGMYGEGAEYGLLHYHNKNTGEESIHLMKIHLDFVEDLIKHLWSVKEDADNGIIPDRPFQGFPNRDYTDLMKSKTVNKVTTKTDWHCIYCDYKDKCWKLNEFKEEENGNGQERSDTPDINTT